jgi:hypothetical protein
MTHKQNPDLAINNQSMDFLCVPTATSVALACNKISKCLSQLLALAVMESLYYATS